MGIQIADEAYTAKAIHSERERGKTLKELAQITAFYLKEEVLFDEAAAQKWLNENGKKGLKALQNKLFSLKSWDEKILHDTFDAIMKELGISKMVELAQPCRVALTGTTVSPGIFEVMAILGKERVLKRFEAALKK